MKVKKTRILIVVAVVIALMSCGTAKDITYVEDIQQNVTIALQKERQIKLQPGDKLDISVHSRDTELAEMFNQNTNGSKGYYTVDATGKIDMPILGLLSVEGKTRMEVAELIKYRIIAAKLVRDPTVTVDYADMGYYVIGEVGHAGRFDIDRDKITLLEGIAMAGDLTIQGKRTNVLVLRTEDGKQTPYRVDLTKTDDLYSSPAYYLQQNDMIYVEPNKMRKNQSTLNANTLQTPAFWMSAVSFVLTIIALVAN